MAQVLVCQLRAGDVVIMADLSTYKRAAERGKIEAAGLNPCNLALYSRDFKLIEGANSRLQDMLRKAPERTVRCLSEFIGRLNDTILPTESANYFRPWG